MVPAAREEYMSQPHPDPWDWRLWPVVALRSAGFPMDDLIALGDEQAADHVAQAGGRDADELTARWSAAYARSAARTGELAATDGVRQALLWQNPAALQVVERVHALDQPRPSRRRFRDRMLTRYLQRYHSRNESVGFFGPIAIARVDPAVPRLTARPGSHRHRDSRAYFEDWAIVALADRLAQQCRLRHELPPAWAVGTVLDGRTVLRPDRPPRRLTGPEQAVLALVDGRSTARAIAAGLGDVEVFAVLHELTDSGYLHWGFDIPMDLEPERALREQLQALPPGEVTGAALEVLDRWDKIRRTAADATDATALAAALDQLDDDFQRTVAAPATRTATEAPYGRRLLHPMSRRDVDLRLGVRLVAELAEPLAAVLDAARWFVGRMGAVFVEWAQQHYAELAPLYRGARVPLDVLCGRLIPMSLDPALTLAVEDELVARWGRLLPIDPAARRVRSSVADLVGRAGLFACEPVSWPGGRYHSPDVMIAARDVQAIVDGDYEFVMGELHVGLVTADSSTVRPFLEFPDEIQTLSEAGLRPDEHRFMPLHPRADRMLTGRSYPQPESFSPRYRYLSFGPRTGARPAPGPVTVLGSAWVRREQGELVVVLAGGEELALLTVLGEYVSAMASSRFRLAPKLAHTPRVTLDRLVVSRETWRFAAAELLSAATRHGGAADFHQVRLVAAHHDLPRFLFWRASPQTKPMLLDLSNPLSVNLLTASLRGRPDDTVTLTEMLPEPARLWLTDAAGQRYTSELRFTAEDRRVSSFLDRS